MLRGSTGDRQAATQALAAAQKAVSDPFETKMLDVCRGRLTAADVLADVTDETLRCGAFYYSGARALVDGRRADARTWFQRCRDTGVHTQPEFDLAQWHLEQLAAD